MCARNLGDTRDQQQLAAALANLADKNYITPDMDTEQWTRKQFQMPRKLEPRPLVSDADIKEIINIVQQKDKQNGAGGAATAEYYYGTSTTNTRADRGGNMGKGNNVS